MAIQDKGKPTYIYHFGDLDPSEIHFERPAVTRPQVEEWNLPTRPTKQTDTRAKKFGNDTSVELDAIPARKLRELVREVMNRHVDQQQLEFLRTAEKSERELLTAWAATYRATPDEYRRRRRWRRHHRPALPGVMHYPDALPQGDARRWPACHGCLVGRFGYLEVVHASDVLHDAVAGVVPNVHAEGKVRLGFHGQVPTRLVLARWYLYRHVVASRSLPRLLRALPAQPSHEAARWGWVAARDQTRRLPNACAPRCGERAAFHPQRARLDRPLPAGAPLYR
jgi:hypothetical protein